MGAEPELEISNVCFEFRKPCARVIAVSMNASFTPGGANPSVLLHAVERGIERALFDAEEVGGRLLDLRRDRVAVHRAARAQCLEHKQVERPLENVVSGLRHVIGWVIQNKLCITSLV